MSIANGCICVRKDCFVCNSFQVNMYARPVYLHHQIELDITQQGPVTHVLRWLHFQQGDFLQQKMQQQKMTPQGRHWHHPVQLHHLHHQLRHQEINLFWVWHKSVLPVVCWFKAGMWLIVTVWKCFVVSVSWIIFMAGSFVCKWCIFHSSLCLLLLCTTSKLLNINYRHLVFSSS